MADVGDQIPSSDSPTTPFRKIVLPADETVMVPRPVERPQPPDHPPVRPGQSTQQVQPGQGQPVQPLPPIPPPPPPLKGGLLARVGDIPIKVVYLLGAIIATVLAVVLVFVIFSGDVPKGAQQSPRQVAPISPVPGGSASPRPSAAGVVLPEVPKSLAYPDQAGAATLTVGTISDLATGISYPRLGVPWTAKSFAPFAIAQRVGKVAVPHTVIGSAMLPGATPKPKPAKSADYRDLAVRAVNWTLRTQYPAGATIAWTGSQKVPVGKGWMVGYKVTYTVSGKQKTSQAIVSIHEVGKTKPAMLFASIPQSGKSHYRDLNTIAQNIRTL
ncbi:hypothetical protein [Nonomuraea aurantiaca]|uniref:hypothetical protein n=1 Tax=Nonomuraea aurantiaca TaxID=2878562 RepID=UPI001CDA4FEE|nr:hypothetical protein [Nonomuraea aurantiaca]MCA2225465.1 hypothetical protein [Nonomuraea aurantiaca]